MAALKAASVFSGQWELRPRWATISGLGNGLTMPSLGLRVRALPGANFGKKSGNGLSFFLTKFESNGKIKGCGPQGNRI
jgi:hypothetical protein